MSSITIAWTLVGIILIVWGIFELRVHVRRADERVERDLIDETDKELEEWKSEWRERMGGGEFTLTQDEIDELAKLKELIGEHIVELTDEEITAVLRETIKEG